MTNANLTGQELQFVALRARGIGDRKLCQELGISHSEALAMSHAIRGKLGLAPGASIRDYARQARAAA